MSGVAQQAASPYSTISETRDQIMRRALDSMYERIIEIAEAALLIPDHAILSAIVINDGRRLDNKTSNE